jgi:hypothetical protein
MAQCQPDSECQSALPGWPVEVNLVNLKQPGWTLEMARAFKLQALDPQSDNNMLVNSSAGEQTPSGNTRRGPGSVIDIIGGPGPGAARVPGP